MNEWTVLVIVVVPLVALWIRSMVEVARRQDFIATQKLTWLLILVLFPVAGLAAYVVARTPPPVRQSGGRPDAHRAEQLVLLAERRQRGDLDDAEFASAAARLRASVLAPSERGSES